MPDISDDGHDSLWISPKPDGAAEIAFVQAVSAAVLDWAAPEEGDGSLGCMNLAPDRVEAELIARDALMEMKRRGVLRLSVG